MANAVKGKCLFASPFMGLYILRAMQLKEISLLSTQLPILSQKSANVLWGEKFVFRFPSFQSTKLAPRKPPEAFFISLPPIKSLYLRYTGSLAWIANELRKKKMATNCQLISGLSHWNCSSSSPCCFRSYPMPVATRQQFIQFFLVVVGVLACCSIPHPTWKVTL